MAYDETRKKASPFERLGDKFSTADDGIAYVAGVAEDIKAMLGGLSGGGAVTIETTQIRFQETLAALTGDRFTYPCPWDAINTSIAMHFPSGCNALVDVAVGHSDKQSYPRQNYIALNDASPVFTTAEKIAYNEPIWVEIRNADGGFAHTITIILTLQRRA